MNRDGGTLPESCSLLFSSLPWSGAPLKARNPCRLRPRKVRFLAPAAESRPRARPQKLAGAVPQPRAAPARRPHPAPRPVGQWTGVTRPQGGQTLPSVDPNAPQAREPPEAHGGVWGPLGGATGRAGLTWVRREGSCHPLSMGAQRKGGKRGRRTEVCGARIWFPERTDERARGQRRAGWDRCRDTLRPGREALRSATAGRSPPGRPSDLAGARGQSCSPLPCSRPALLHWSPRQGCCRLPLSFSCLSWSPVEMTPTEFLSPRPTVASPSLYL